MQRRRSREKHRREGKGRKGRKKANIIFAPASPFLSFSCSIIRSQFPSVPAPSLPIPFITTHCLTSSYVRLATEWMALLQNRTSKMFASSSISHITEKAKWSARGKKKKKNEMKRNKQNKDRRKEREKKRMNEWNKGKQTSNKVIEKEERNKQRMKEIKVINRKNKRNQKGGLQISACLCKLRSPLLDGSCLCSEIRFSICSYHRFIIIHYHENL